MDGTELTLFDFVFEEDLKEESNASEYKDIKPINEEIVKQEQGTPIFQIGDIVKVRPPSADDDIETYYYLQDFQKKEGKIVDIGRHYNPVAYFVEFRNGQAVLNVGDLIQVVLQE